VEDALLCRPCSGKEVRNPRPYGTTSSDHLTSDFAYRAGSGEDGVPQVRQDGGQGQRLAQEQAGEGRADLPALLWQGGTCTHDALSP